jgi:hypothetical protein
MEWVSLSISAKKESWGENPLTSKCSPKVSGRIFYGAHYRKKTAVDEYSAMTYSRFLEIFFLGDSMNKPEDIELTTNLSFQRGASKCVLSKKCFS